MLSGETTVGDYPVETVTYMASIAEDTENHCTRASVDFFDFHEVRYTTFFVQ